MPFRAATFKAAAMPLREPSRIEYRFRRPEAGLGEPLAAGRQPADGWFAIGCRPGERSPAGRPGAPRTFTIDPEASPSQVYGAGLLIPLGCKPLARSNRAASAVRPGGQSSGPALRP